MSRFSIATAGLLALVAVRLVFHAVYVPVFEGPDEPFHLARAVAFVEVPPGIAMAGTWVGGEIAGAIEGHPCGPNLARVFECPPFGDGSGAEFNILRPSPWELRGEPPANYESHQPPLYYLGGAVFLSAARLVAGSRARAGDPAFQLLALRLFSVLLVLGALFGPLYAMARARSPAWLWGCSILLLAPGASEALARCANDAGVFAWAAVLVWAIDRSMSTSSIAFILLLGPLIKLTSLPIVAFALVWLFLDRPLRHAAFSSLASLAFLPIQWLRGYTWGGTVEANSPAQSLQESLAETLIGLLRSTYTLIKTGFWLGEWSFFRAPIWLLVGLAVYLGILAVTVRLRPLTREQLPHLAGLGAAAASVLFFFISHRMYWDQWGGVGGWYLWGWAPWIWVAFPSLFDVSKERARWLLWGALALVVIANAAWFRAAHSLYS